MILGRYMVHERLHLGDRTETLFATEAKGETIRHVVVKAVLDDHRKDDAYVKAFTRAAELTQLLVVPTVCQIYQLESSAEQVLLAREYVPGNHLRALARRLALQRRYAPLPIVARIIGDLCTGLSQAHAMTTEEGEPVIHGNLGAANILISFEGQVKLINFAPAGTAATLGTPIAPEQAAGAASDVTTDVFAVGLALHELLTNMQAFREGFDGEWRKPSEVRPELAPFDEPVCRALDKKPDARQESAVALAEQVAAALSQAEEQPVNQEAVADFIKKLLPNHLRITKEQTSRALAYHRQHGPAPSAAQPRAEKAPPPPALSETPAAPQAAPSRRQHQRPPTARVPVSGAKRRLPMLLAATVGLLGGVLIYFVLLMVNAPDPESGLASTLAIESTIPVRVFVDDQPAPYTPPTQIRVAPGQHALTIVLTKNNKKITQQLEVPEGRRMLVRLFE